MSARAQRILLWWSIGFGVIYGTALVFLLRMIPPPRATWSAEKIASFYREHATSIRIGAVITSWTGAFFIPLGIVIALQIARLEGGQRVWAITSGAGGIMTSIFLVFPPIFWGVAAFTPTRSADATAILHELGLLSFFTTDQFFIFMWVPIVVMCFRGSNLPHSPFPRWFGYYLVLMAGVITEPTVLAYLARTGPFAWNGLFIFWIPVPAFGAWVLVIYPRLFAALRGQALDEDEADRPPLARPAEVSL